MLRPYQVDAVHLFNQRHDHRLILAHATSAGKTLTALTCAQTIGARRILVACPALARPTWAREFAKWAPGLTPHPVRFGRNRKGLSKAKDAERTAAYSADVQIVSYKLLKEIDSSPRDLLILDELHALRDPLSQQSRIVRAYRTAHPKLAMLGLTATPIPTEVRQLWCPLDTFWPGAWGRKHPAGDVSWDFQAKYCYREENEYGVRYVGSKSPEALAQLAGALGPYMHRVTDKEVAPFLPPLHADPLYLDEKRPMADVAQEWLDEVRAGGAKHIIVICYNRDAAAELGAKLGADAVITGEASVEYRDTVFQGMRIMGSSLIVATSESIREAISLSYVERALIFQWRTSPAQAIQLLGRFPRQDAVDLTRPTFVQYVVEPGDEARAEILNSRIKDIQNVMASDRKSEQLIELFKPRELTESRLDSMFAAMMGRFDPDATVWEEDNDE